MGTFRRRKNQDDASDHERVAQEVREALDPYSERALIIEGDRAAVIPGRILENIRSRMERVDLDPNTSWTPEEIMSQEETAAMFVELSMGEVVVTETAWYAREILSRWPAAMVEHQIPPEARIEMFLDGPTIDPEVDDIARRVINRALASPTHVEEHPELTDLDSELLVGVWLAVVFWFGIKSGLLHQRAGND